MCDSTQTGCAPRITLYIYVERTSNNTVIAAHDRHCCLLPQREALRTCRSGFLIATIPLGKPVAPFKQQLLLDQGCHGWALLLAHSLGEALHWVCFICEYAAITTPQKERLCFALSLCFFNGTWRSIFCSFLPHNALVKTYFLCTLFIDTHYFNS